MLLDFLKAVYELNAWAVALDFSFVVWCVKARWLLCSAWLMLGMVIGRASK